MTPNPTSAKAKLFALYLGQNFTINNHDWRKEYSDLEPEYELELHAVNIGGACFDDNIELDWPIEDCYLQLRSIADLTDQEYGIMAKWSAYELTDKNIVEVGNAMVRHLFELNKWSGHTILEIIDYLRSISVALPFTVLEDGKPRTYSVEEQVENKWITVNNK